MTAGVFDALRRRDEILEVMYWLRGERLGDAAGPDDLQAFLAADTHLLRDDLATLASDDLVERIGAGEERYRLTERGIREGGRRFADSFADFQRPGHGECNRPGCVCRQFGPEACIGLAGRPERG